MARSGTPLVVIGVLAVLGGCAGAPASSPTPDDGSPPAGSPSPAPPACPDGLEDALEGFLAGRPLGDRVPDSVDVEELTGADFGVDLTAEAGCVFTVARQFPDALHVELFGIATAAGADDLRGILEGAGWVQPHPGAAPYAWEPPGGGAGIGLHPRGGDALGFPDWTAYLGADDVLVQGSMPF